MKHKLFSLIFVIMASLSIVRASETQVDGIWYDFSENTAIVTYHGSSSMEFLDEYSGSIKIPATVKYNNTTYTVTSIGENAFDACMNLKSVILPKTLTSIGYGAFNDCTSLTSVTIPQGVTCIEKLAFCNCSSLKSVAIPNTVTVIGLSAFANCTSLESISIPQGVTTIKSLAFSGCEKLKSVTIPKSVTSISVRAFSQCKSLSIKLPKSLEGKVDLSDCKSVTYY